ncbi:MAG: (E)-4-hydroxy-3-methylbut-2-enyl-diphosphate synthase [Bacteroidota bacterium]
MESDFKYCNSLTAYSRFKTQVIHIGNVPMGGHFPIRIQSMTNTNTLDTEATVSQAIRMIETGCEYVRIATPGMKEAENLLKIKKELRAKGYETPLIADVHFNPAVAEHAARIVEKVRINPGNYTDRKKAENSIYNEDEYNKELENISERISPLIKICKEYGTVIRIGTNHGSLSDRIVQRYGDTPLGMAESALEFIRICEELDFRNIVLSMKASNTRVMITAYRLLVNRMMKEGMNYPLHIGVTEAGSGSDGRIRSAVGIGSLLEDGIGDTIRVSLTEDPEAEVPVAKILVSRYTARTNHDPIKEIETSPVNPFEFHKHFTNEVLNIGKNNNPVVISDANENEPNCADYVFRKSLIEKENSIINAAQWHRSLQGICPLFEAKEYFHSKKKSPLANFVTTDIGNLNDDFIDKIKKDLTAVLVLESENKHASPEIRRMIFELINQRCKNPIIIKRDYSDFEPEEFMIAASADIGLLLADGLCDGIWLSAENVSAEIIEKTSFDILQAAGARIYKTEYISCPTCGRTLFNIFETLQRIKQFTSHLKGLKIAVMGCVVNGPGEMADADYGYVGSSSGKINLYKGKDLVRRNIDEKEALDALIELIKENGDWEEEKK